MLEFYSNIQRLVINNGKVERVSDNRETHSTRREAFERVLRAKSAAGKPKSTVYLANRQYTVVL